MANTRAPQPHPDYELLFAQTPGEMLLVFAPDLTMVAANRLWYAHTGMTAQDIVGKYVFDVFPDNPANDEADGVGNMKASLDRVAREKTSDAMPVHRYDIPNPDGSFSVKYWAVTHTPILDDQGNVTQIWNRGTDVTDYMLSQQSGSGDSHAAEGDLSAVVARQYRAASAASRQLKEQLADLPRLQVEAKAATNALANEREQLAAVVASTSEAILTVDAHGVITTANKAAGVLFGYSPGDLVGRNADVLSIDAQDDEFVDFMSLLLDLADDAAGSDGPVQADARREDGNVLPVDISIVPFRQEGELFHAVSFRDRTNEVRRLNKLIRSNQDLERFAYVASHDLQTPARTINSFVELLREDLPPDALTDDTREYLEYLSQSATKMRAQIAGLLQMSRIKEDRDQYKAVDLNASISHAVELLQDSIDECGAQVSLGDLGTVWGDATQIQLLFNNLLSNAIKYRDEERPAVITVFREEGTGQRSQARVLVTDNGIGIPHDQHERVFEIFCRLHADSASQYQGTGIGLALCRRIVDQHGGEIRFIEDGGGPGTSVEVLLPTQDERTPSERDES